MYVDVRASLQVRNQQSTINADLFRVRLIESALHHLGLILEELHLMAACFKEASQKGKMVLMQLVYAPLGQATFLLYVRIQLKPDFLRRPR